MAANELLALIGGIIVAGFLAELIFKIFKIPSVVKLMGIGLLLGPVFEIFPAEEFMSVAPFFGKLALLIILFAGGLGLKIETVIAQLGNAVFLAVLAFGVTFAMAMAVSMFLMKLGTIQSVLLATLCAGTASSIVIPVVSKLSVNDSLKTLLSIESAISNLLILVIVVLVCDIHIADETGIGGILYVFLVKIFVSLLSAVIAGFVWARLIGSMTEESFSYMLTLGFIFLLNFVVSEAGGSGAISILFFGIVLANVQRIFDITGPKIKKILGLEVDSTKYAITEFVKNISKELSFLVATFFFVFLGVLVDFSQVTPSFGINVLFLSLIIALGRFLIIPIFGKFNKKTFAVAETLILISMMPRGLATAVMAFKPAEEPYLIEGTEQFPLYAMFVILVSNIMMTLMVKIGENKIKKSSSSESEVAHSNLNESTSLVELELNKGIVDPTPPIKTSPPEIKNEVNEKAIHAVGESEKVFLPDIEFEGMNIEGLSGFHQLVFTTLRIKRGSYTKFLKNTLSNLRIRNGIYWLKIVGMVVISTLAMLMGRSEIMIASMLLFPMTEPINAVGFGIVTGDIYLLLKANVKILITVFVTVLVAILLTMISPFMGVTEQMINQAQPTVLNFLLSLAAGMILPVLLLKGNKLETLAIIPVMGVLFVPPLVDVGISMALGVSNDSFQAGFWGGLSTFGTNMSCIVIGTVITQFILGFNFLGTHISRELLMDWHELEIENGRLHTFFEKYGLTRILESVGSPFSRVAVLAILGLSVFIPLQWAVDDVQREYKLTANLDPMAKNYFFEEGLSVVTGTAFEDKTNQMLVKIWVSTKDKYGPESIRDFENEMEQKIGVPIQLKLYQSYNTYEDFATMESGAETNSEPMDVKDGIRFFRDRIEDALLPLKVMEGYSYLGNEIRISNKEGEMGVSVFVMGEEDPGKGIESFLSSKIKKELGLQRLILNIHTIPTKIGLSKEDQNTLDENQYLLETVDFLRGKDSVFCSVDLPNGSSEEEINDLLVGFHQFFVNPNRLSYEPGGNDSLILHFYIKEDGKIK